MANETKIDFVGVKGDRIVGHGAKRTERRAAVGSGKFQVDCQLVARRGTRAKPRRKKR